jgi:hypothetical protein
MSLPRDPEPRDIDAEQQILLGRFDVATENLREAQADHDHTKAVRALSDMHNAIRGAGRLLQEL